MAKTIHTPRDDLVCGKLDVLEDKLRDLGLVELLYLTSDIRRDCERMEAKLISRKEEAEQTASKHDMTGAEIMSMYDAEIANGGSADSIIVRMVKRAVAAERVAAELRCAKTAVLIPGNHGYTALKVQEMMMEAVSLRSARDFAQRRKQ